MFRPYSPILLALLFFAAIPAHALQTTFVINGRTVEATLSTTHVGATSAAIDSVSAHGEHFKGTLRGEEDSWVRVSRIDGQWQGLISSNDQLHVLEPAATRQQNREARALAQLALPFSCGLDAHVQATDVPHTLQQAVRDTSTAFLRLCDKAIDNACAAIELEMVFDQQFVRAFSSNYQAQATSLLNIVEGLYAESFGIRFDTLAVTYLTETVFTDDATSNGFLSEVALKKANNSLSFVTSPTAILHIVRGAPFTDEGTAGVAWLQGLCSDQGYSSGTSVLYRATLNSTPSIPITALITTHEIGHNLGAQHDNTPAASCPNGYLMDAIVNPTASEFSSCSKTAIKDHLGDLSAWPSCTDYPVKLDISAAADNTVAIEAPTTLSHRLLLEYAHGYVAPPQATITLTLDGANAANVTLDGDACRANTDGSQWHCTHPRTASAALSFDITPFWTLATVTATTNVGNHSDFYNIAQSGGRYSYQIVAPGPKTPGILKASVNNAQVELNWEDTSTDETGFQLQRRMNAGLWQTLTTLAANTQRYTDTPPTIALYEYRVLAMGQTLSSAPSNVVTVNNGQLISTTSQSGSGGGGVFGWCWLVALAAAYPLRRRKRY